MSKVSFKEIAIAMGMDEDSAKISLSLPPVMIEVLHYRAYCVSELLVQRNLDTINRITGHSWGEVKRVITDQSSVIVLIQLNSAMQYFPLEIPIAALMGHKDGIVQRIRKVEQELQLKLHSWNVLTRGGIMKYPIKDLLQRMKASLEERLIS